MSEDAISEVGKFLLPFAVAFPKKEVDLSPQNMELAGVFSIAELGRRKGGRMILRRSKENIALFLTSPKKEVRVMASYRAKELQ
jgi:hypothetical protein